MATAYHPGLAPIRRRFTVSPQGSTVLATPPRELTYADGPVAARYASGPSAT